MVSTSIEVYNQKSRETKHLNLVELADAQLIRNQRCLIKNKNVEGRLNSDCPFYVRGTDVSKAIRSCKVTFDSKLYESHTWKFNATINSNFVREAAEVYDTMALRRGLMDLVDSHRPILPRGASKRRLEDPNQGSDYPRGSPPCQSGQLSFALNWKRFANGGFS